jgi:hypothetical protein
MSPVLSGAQVKGYQKMRERAEATLRFGTPDMPVGSQVPDTVKNATEMSGADPYASFSSSTTSKAMIWHTNPRGSMSPQPWAKGQMGTVRNMNSGGNLLGVQAEGNY